MVKQSSENALSDYLTKEDAVKCFLLKKTFGQTNFRGNDLSVKRRLPLSLNQMINRSNCIRPFNFCSNGVRPIAFPVK
jgi:hypothetical protein